MMNKHSSISHFKGMSRQKEKGKMNLLKSKGETHPNKSTQYDKGIPNLNKSKQKQTKSSKKDRIDNNRPQTAYNRHKNQNKQESDQYRLDMKADLKHLISKNNVGKAKNNDKVPELLKNIETGCKALKNIHHKQRRFQEKRSSEHSNKVQKSKKQSVQYPNNERKTKQRKSSKEDARDIKPIPPKISRFSLQINESGVEKTKIDHKLRQKESRKSTENKEQQKNFVELFKLYKKSFEIEQFKMEKTNRNTNYNTNQSKNSSTHHNSHCPSRTGDFNYRGKSREQDKMNIQKIEMLIKNQQKRAEVGEIQVDSLINTQRVNFNQNKEAEYISIDCKKINRQFQNFSVKQQNIYAESIFQPDATFLNKHYMSNLAKNLQNESLLKQRVECNQQPIILDKKLLSHEERLVEEVNQKVLQKKFEKSKFYVQPIPKFELRNQQNLQQEEEESLLGCQITLIENNLVLQDSELASLQL